MRGPDRPEKLEKQTPSGEEGAAQRVLLLVLLLVVVLFGYLYFFTGVIKPREEATSPAIVSSVEKKPIPPRPEAEKTAGKGEQDKSPNAVTPEQSGKGAVSPEKGKASPPESMQAQPKKEQVPPPKTAPVKQQPAVAASPKTAIPAPAVKEKPKAPKTALPDGGKEKKATGSAATPSKAKAPEKKAGAEYALLVGDFIVESNLKNAQRQLKKFGISAFTVSSRTKPESMHRLRVGDYASRSDAETELKKVQKVSSSAFILPANGKYSVFAGSYYEESKAAQEKGRLNGLPGGNLSVTVEKADVNVPVKRLVAGAFPDKASATAEAGRLKKAGIKASVIPLRKTTR